MIRTISLNEKLLRMPSKIEHFTVTRFELLFVHSRCLARARPRSSFTLVHVLSATLSIRLSTHVCVRRSFGSGRLLRGTRPLPFRGGRRLRFGRLALRLLRLRRLA